MSFNNWIGYSDVNGGVDYRSLSIGKNGVTHKLFEKNESPNSPAYIGVCGIKDYEEFWSLIDEKAILTGESYAIQKMIEKDIRFDSIKFEWYDTGNKDKFTL